MATNPDAATTSIPIRVTWTPQGTLCAQPAVIESLQQANFRIDLPNSVLDPSQQSFTASTLDGNIFRIDSTGAGYVPGITKVELAEQTVTLSDTDSPTDTLELSFAASGVADLENVVPAIYFEITPPGSAVAIGPPRDVGTDIRFTVNRVDIGGTAPFPVITVRGRGRIFIIPSPEPA